MHSPFRPLIALLIATVTLAPLSRAQTPPPPGPIAAKLQPFVDHHTLAGAVLLVANKDKILNVETVGFADIAANKPIAADSIFWIASQSKAITAAAIMILVDEGKLSVDDPVEKYLPEFKAITTVNETIDGKVVNKPLARPITIKNCLTHTSGLPFKSAAETPTLDALPLADAVKSYTTSPLTYQPGEKYAYSNAGINTAGRIIEVVSGMPYETFLDVRLFKPLGMKDTTFWPSEAQVARIAKSYKPNKAKDGLDETPVTQLRYPLTDRAHRFPMPGGGLFSTASDTAAFCQMLLAGGTYNGQRILSAASVQQMTCTQNGDLQNKGKGENGYGYGLQTSRKVKGDPTPGSGGNFGHGGAHATNMQIDPAKNLILIYMVQHAGFPNTDGKDIYPTFQKTAMEKFGQP